MSIEQQFLIMIDPDFLLDDKNPNRITTPEAYVNDVRSVILKINRSKVGNALLRSIRWHGKGVRISPTSDLTHSVEIPGELKDFTWNKNLRAVSNMPGIQFLANLTGIQLLPIRAVVKFIPQFCAAGPACVKDFMTHNDFRPTPESVLFHELVHALRDVSGKARGHLPRLGSGFNRGGAEGEEFIAVLVTNIFESEVGGQLRTSYPAFRSLDSSLEGSFEYFRISKKAFSVIDTFCRENRGFTLALAKIDVRFNPIAAYYKDPEKAKAMSNSDIAARRDSALLDFASDLTPSVPVEVWRMLLGE